MRIARADDLPLRGDLIASLEKQGTGFTPIWESKSRGLWIKRSEGIWNVKFHPFNYKGRFEVKRRKAVIDAIAHARFFQDLADRGFYHPKTRFIVSRSETGNPEIVAIMPHMQMGVIRGVDMARFTRDCEAKVERLKADFNLKQTDLHYDVAHPHNWGTQGNDVHYADFELFLDKMPPALLNIYRRKVLRQRIKTKK